MSIRDADALTDLFGRRPTFRDAEVVSILLDRRGKDGPTLTAEILLFDTTGEGDGQGSRAGDTDRLVTLRFLAVKLHDLVGSDQQNALFSLEISERGAEEAGGRRSCVDFDPSYGCGASFACREVVSVEPLDGP